MSDKRAHVETALRVLTAIAHKCEPDIQDVETLRRIGSQFRGAGSERPLDQIACELITSWIPQLEEFNAVATLAGTVGPASQRCDVKTLTRMLSVSSNDPGPTGRRAKAPVDSLTRRELQVLLLMAEGRTSRQIA